MRVARVRALLAVAHGEEGLRVRLPRVRHLEEHGDAERRAREAVRHGIGNLAGHGVCGTVFGSLREDAVGQCEPREVARGPHDKILVYPARVNVHEAIQPEGLTMTRIVQLLLYASRGITCLGCLACNAVAEVKRGDVVDAKAKQMLAVKKPVIAAAGASELLFGLAATSNKPSLEHALSIIADALEDALEELLGLLREAEEAGRRATVEAD